VKNKKPIQNIKRKYTEKNNNKKTPATTKNNQTTE
jgi:hypothetical protein